MTSRRNPPPGLILNMGIQQDSNSPQSRPARQNPADLQSPAPLPSALSSSQDSINQLSRSAQNLSLNSSTSNSSSLTRKSRPVKIDLGRGFNAALQDPAALEQVAAAASAEPEPAGVSVHQQQIIQQNQLREQAEQNTAENIVKQYQQDLKDEDFDTLDELGVGSGGTVYRVRHRPTNSVMAKKLIHQLDFKISKEIISELKILDKCKSDYIVSFYGAFAVQGELCICMEFMDVGSFEKILKIARKIPERVLGKTTVAVLNGLTYLYETLRIIHRDIKPSNILINSRGHVKLCDFGVSKALEGSLLNVESFIGTSAYMSPERIEGKNYTAKCDTWAFGLTLLELATGRYPFHSDTYAALNSELGGENESPDWGGDVSVFEILQQITTQPAPALPGRDEPEGDEYTDEFRDFIAVSLRKDPTSRPAPSTLLNHPFVRNSARQVVDMAAWARQYLDPNLDDAQLTRWDVAQRQKRKSITTAKENRLNLKQASANHHYHHHSGASTPLPTTSESLTEDEESLSLAADSAMQSPALQQPQQQMQPPPRRLPVNLAPPPMKPKMKPTALSLPRPPPQ